MKSFYFTEELQTASLKVQTQYPMLAYMINQLNGQLINIDRRKFAAYPVLVEKSILPWKKPQYTYRLLFGEIDEHQAKMEEIPVKDPLSYLYGVWDSLKMKSERDAWDKFINLLNEVDDMETKNFLGGIERYKRIFLEANK